MPELGEVRQHNKHSAGTSIWSACVDCGKQRWVRFRNGIAEHPRCWSCSNKRTAKRGSENNMWKGGLRKVGQGYIAVRVYPDDFFYAMANGHGYILEHRLVMAKHIGRCLHPWEIVHHKNHIKDDNRIKNLQLVSDDRHKQISHLENKICFLRAENKRLRQIIKGSGLGIVP